MHSVSSDFARPSLALSALGLNACDAGFCAAWEALGVAPGPLRSDAASGLGPPVHASTYAELFQLTVRAGIFTKSGRFTKHYRDDPEPKPKRRR